MLAFIMPCAGLQIDLFSPVKNVQHLILVVLNWLCIGDDPQMLSNSEGSLISSYAVDPLKLYNITGPCRTSMATCLRKS